jgi:hypothetical protein
MYLKILTIYFINITTNSNFFPFLWWLWIRWFSISKTLKICTKVMYSKFPILVAYKIDSSHMLIYTKVHNKIWWLLKKPTLGYCVLFVLKFMVCFNFRIYSNIITLQANLAWAQKFSIFEATSHCYNIVSSIFSPFPRYLVHVI